MVLVVVLACEAVEGEVEAEAVAGRSVGVDSLFEALGQVVEERDEAEVQGEAEVQVEAEEQVEAEVQVEAEEQDEAEGLDEVEELDEAGEQDGAGEQVSWAVEQREHCRLYKNKNH